MTRLLRDSIDPAAIPKDTPLVGYYVDGWYGPDHAAFGKPGWDAAAVASFPDSIMVGIAVRPGTNAGIVGDCEAFDMTNQQIVSWVVMRRQAGTDPTVYCSRANWDAVRAAFAAAGVQEPHWWIADYDGTTDIYPGAVARQYDNGTGFVGPSVNGAYDSSAVADHWPGVDPAPAPPTDEEDDMADVQSATRPDGGTDVYARLAAALPGGGNVVHYIKDPGGHVTWVDYPGGMYLRLTEVGYWNTTEAFIRGIGTDGRVWQTVWNPGDDGWEAPVRLA